MRSRIVAPSSFSNNQAPTQAFGALSINPNVCSGASSSSTTPGSYELSSRAGPATSNNTHSLPSQTSSRLGLRKRLSGTFEAPRKLVERIPDLPDFLATMSGLTLIRDAVDSVRTMQDTTTLSQQLAEFGSRLKLLLDRVNSTDRPKDSRYMTPAFVAFKQHIEAMYGQVQREVQLQPSRISRLDDASRLIELIDDYRNKLAELVENAMVDACIQQEFDSTIPTLRLISRESGLVLQRVISTTRYDGSPIDDSPLQDHLCLTIHRGTFNDNPVEVKSFYGGSEEYLIRTARELVENHQAFGMTSNVQELYGGVVERQPDGQLHAYLVFSPLEGQSWMSAVKSQRSVELLCRVAEETTKAFQHLKLHKQINWESIRVRPDGTVLIVPTTEGDNFMIDETIFDPFNLDDNIDFDWPLRELCQLLHEATKQGVLLNATAELKAHDGPWTKINVWKIARKIGLRPPEEKKMFAQYPPDAWMVDPGWIMHWSGSDAPEFVSVMPKQGLSKYERRHFTSCKLTMAVGNQHGQLVDYMEPGVENWFTPTDDGQWECVALEPWQDVDMVLLMYESMRIEMIEWKSSKRILEFAADRKKLRLDNLAITVRTESYMKIQKCDVPELGTRPLYFYRKRNDAVSAREYWGFYTFNKDPQGPTGLEVRCSGPNGWGRIVSESLPPDPANFFQEEYGIQFEVFYVNMHSDWDALIEAELADGRLNYCGEPTFNASDIEWDDDEPVNQD